MPQPPIRKTQLTPSQRYWLGHLQQQQQSSLSKAEYARQHGLTLTTFYTMHQKLRRVAAEELSQPAPLFQAVNILSEPARVQREGLTLAFQLPGLMACEVRQLDVRACAALLRQLAEQPA